MSKNTPTKEPHLSDIMATVFGYCEEQNQRCWNEAVQLAANVALEKPIPITMNGVSVLVDGERITPNNLQSHFEAAISKKKVKTVRMNAESKKAIIFSAHETRQVFKFISAGRRFVSPFEIKAPFYLALQKNAESNYNRLRTRPSMWDHLREEICKRLRLDIVTTALDGIASWRWKGWHVGTDVLTIEIARLHDDGVTQDVLAELCREYPDDARAAGLLKLIVKPRPEKKIQSCDQLRKRAEEYVKRIGYPGLNVLAARLECAPSSLNNAIKKSPSLKARKAEHQLRQKRGMRTVQLSEIAMDDHAEQLDRENQLAMLTADQKADDRADRRKPRSRPRSATNS